MVLVLCTSPDGALYLYQASKNILEGFRVIKGTPFVTDRQTDGYTDTQTDSYGKNGMSHHVDNIIILWKLVVFQI